MGMAASMGAFLLAAGTPGKRSALPNSRIMIHQPSGGSQGTASDIEIQAREVLYARERLNELLAKHTGQTIEQIGEDVDRDRYMSPGEARDYGIIDRIIEQAGGESDEDGSQSPAVELTGPEAVEEPDSGS